MHETESGAQDRHDHRLHGQPRAGAVVSGVSTVASTVGRSSVASAINSVPIRSRFWRNRAFGVVAVADAGDASATSGWSTDGDR